MNVTDYVIQLRMTRAKEWVMDEQIPFKHVAEMAGYEDVSYFYRVFKKHFGVSPGEMRKGQLVYQVNQAVARNETFERAFAAGLRFKIIQYTSLILSNEALSFSDI